MATKRVEFTLTLDRTGIPPTAVVLEVDSSGDDEIQPNEGVLMATADGLTWVGYSDVDHIDGTIFFLRFTAPKNTEWDFEATHDGDSVYSAKNQKMKKTKAVLVGRLEE